MHLRVLSAFVFLAACAAPERDALLVDAEDLLSAVALDGPMKVTFILTEPTPGTAQALRDALVVVELKRPNEPPPAFTVDERASGGDTLIEVTLEDPPDAWIFIGFSAVPQQVEHALRRIEGAGFGVRLRAGHGPTPRLVRLCRSDFGSTGYVHFSEAVTIIPPGIDDDRDPLDLVNCQPRYKESGGSSAVLFGCAAEALDGASLSLLLRTGVIATEGEAPVEVLRGGLPTTFTLHAEDALRLNGCLEWRLQ